MYEECFSNGLSAFFTKGPTIYTIVRYSIVSDLLRHAASPVKLRKRWQIFHDVLRHWSTFWYWYHPRESYTLRKQASDLHGGRQLMIYSTLDRSLQIIKCYVQLPVAPSGPRGWSGLVTYIQLESRSWAG